MLPANAEAPADDDDADADEGERWSWIAPSARRPWWPLRIRQMIGLEGDEPRQVVEKDRRRPAVAPDSIQRHRHPASLDAIQGRAVRDRPAAGGRPRP